MCAKHDQLSWRFFRFAVGALALSAAVAMWTVAPSSTMAAANGPLTPNEDVIAPASFASVIEAVKPAVVNIAVKGRKPTVGRLQPGIPFGAPGAVPGDPLEDFMRRFFDRGVAPRTDDGMPFEGVGTGFIVDAAGFVVTNYHVIEDAEEIVVTLDDGRRYQAELRGNDEKTDLALLLVDPGEPLPYVAFGDSDATRVGDWVVAIGNPFGLGGTATTGIVSARGRDIRSGPFDDFLQIDAPINSGNSGGPLFDLNGRVVGVNAAIYSPNGGGNVGIGFAIPSAMAEPIVEELRERGRIERGWLGVQIQGLDNDMAAGLGLDGPQGALVADVVEGSPAALAGLRTGDVIMGFAGETIEEVRDLTRAVAAMDPDDRVTVEVWRGGDVHHLTAALGASPDDVGRLETLGVGGEEAAELLGVTVGALHDDTRRRLGIDAEVTGVVVTGVATDSTALRKGLRRGDVIVMVGQKPVADPREYHAAIEHAVQDGRGAVLLQVLRGGATRFVALPVD